MKEAKQDLYSRLKKVALHMRHYYKIPISKLKLADLPGFWIDTEGYIYEFLDWQKLPNGRFASPFYTWRMLKENEDFYEEFKTKINF